MMNYKTTLILVGVLLIYVTPAFTQTSLRGSVVSEAGEKIESYLLILQSPADLSIAAVKMFSDTVFWFGGIKPQPYILRVQDVQYQPYDTLITVVEGANVLKAPLVLKPATLGEVVIKGSLPVITYKHGDYTADVANSYLKDEVSMESLLDKLPGIIVENRTVSAFGSNPLIYINRKEVRSPDELRSLQPINIDKIEVIRNVGAEYSSNAGVVIKIKTKNKRAEKVFISLTDELWLRHYVTNDVNLSLYLGLNEKLSQYFTFNNFSFKIRSGSKSHVYTYLDDYTNVNFRDVFGVSNQPLNSLSYSLNYSISKDKEFGVYYNGRYSDRTDNGWATQRIYHDEELSKTINSNSVNTDEYNSHDINLNYAQQINNTGELSVVADYVINASSATNDVNESSIEDIEHINNRLDVSDRDSRVFSVKSQYKVTEKRFNYNYGVNYSSLTSNSDIEYRRPLPGIENIQMSEYTGAAYMAFEADLRFLYIKSGLRMEYTNSKIKYDNGSNDSSDEYFNLFPAISLSKDVNKNFGLTTYYRRIIQRPSLTFLNPKITYRDSLTYSTGNPHLKPATINAFNVNIKLYSFDFTASYDIYKNALFWENVQDNSNPSVTVNTFSNIEKYRALRLALIYSFERPVFNSRVDVSYRKSRLTVPFWNEITGSNKPTYTFRILGNIKITENTNFNSSFSYTSPGDSENTRRSSRSNLSATITQHFMKKKLMTSLSIHDIFEGSKNYRITSYSNNIISVRDNLSPDTRYVSFTVRYNWGKNKRIQRKMSDTDQIGRLRSN
jgi:hypothetical protein